MNKYRKWVTFGRLAAIVLSHNDPRPRLVRETELADHLGLSRATLRHYRDAVVNVRVAIDIDSRHLFFAQSAVAANTMARWYLRDPIGVERFIAKQWPRGDAEIISAARDAKLAGRGRRNDLALPEMVSNALKSGPPIFEETLASLLGARPDEVERLGVRSGQSETAQFLGIDVEVLDPALEHQSGETGIRIGLIEIRPLVTLERHRQEARSIWTRAVAASLHYNLVVIVFPGPASRRRLLAALPTDIGHWVSRPAEGRYKERSDRCASTPMLCRPAARTGTILISTRYGLAVDLFGPSRRRQTYWSEW